MKTEFFPGYEYEPYAADLLTLLKREGGALLRGFVPEQQQVEIVDSVLAHELTPVDRSGHAIPEQFDDVGWTFTDSPAPVRHLGQTIQDLMQVAVPAWEITDVRAQLYRPGEVGIEWHRDYKRDLRIVAVASFLGSALFEIQLDSGATVSQEILPGDLVLMRGSLLTGTVDDRPLHRVAAPQTGQRLSIAYRQEVATVPVLEPHHE